MSYKFDGKSDSLDVVLDLKDPKVFHLWDYCLEGDEIKIAMGIGPCTCKLCAPVKHDEEMKRRLEQP